MSPEDARNFDAALLSRYCLLFTQVRVVEGEWDKGGANINVCVQTPFYMVMTAPLGERGEKKEEYRSDEGGGKENKRPYWRPRLHNRAYRYVTLYSGVHIPDKRASWTVFDCVNIRHMAVPSGTFTCGPFSNGATKTFKGKEMWAIELGPVRARYRSPGEILCPGALQVNVGREGGVSVCACTSHHTRVCALQVSSQAPLRNQPGGSWVIDGTESRTSAPATPTPKPGKGKSAPPSRTRSGSGSPAPPVNTATPLAYAPGHSPREMAAFLAATLRTELKNMAAVAPAAKNGNGRQTEAAVRAGVRDGLASPVLSNTLSANVSANVSTASAEAVTAAMHTAPRPAWASSQGEAIRDMVHATIAPMAEQIAAMQTMLCEVTASARELAAQQVQQATAAGGGTRGARPGTARTALQQPPGGGAGGGIRRSARNQASHTAAQYPPGGVAGQRQCDNSAATYNAALPNAQHPHARAANANAPNAMFNNAALPYAASILASARLKRQREDADALAEQYNAKEQVQLQEMAKAKLAQQDKELAALAAENQQLKLEKIWMQKEEAKNELRRRQERNDATAQQYPTFPNGAFPFPADWPI